MISLKKLKILTPLQKLPKNVRDLGKLIVAKGFKKLPKMHKIAQSGHTEGDLPRFKLNSLGGYLHTEVPVCIGRRGVNRSGHTK